MAISKGNRPESQSGQFIMPKIINIEYKLERYEKPKILLTKLWEATSYDNAIELLVTTDRPIPAEATTPALFIGEILVPGFETVGTNLYQFYVYDYRNLPDSATIYFGWPNSPKSKVQTGFTFKKNNLSRK
ncbi:MAG: hypothetical protein ACKVT2_22405 [Saprospiraceae bacterium]